MEINVKMAKNFETLATVERERERERERRLVKKALMEANYGD